MIKKMLGIVFMLAVLQATPAGAASPETNVAQQVLCQCGCNLSVATCSHENCSSRESMKKLIVEKLGEGLTEQQVVQYFVAQYGEAVLVTPPKRGFNLIAWILPFAVIIVGALIVFLALKKWVFQGRIAEVEAEEAEAVEGEDEKYRRRLERELKQFGERGYR